MTFLLPVLLLREVKEVDPADIYITTEEEGERKEELDLTSGDPEELAISTITPGNEKDHAPRVCIVLLLRGILLHSLLCL
jgi:hypothetical protein